MRCLSSLQTAFARPTYCALDGGPLLPQPAMAVRARAASAAASARDGVDHHGAEPAPVGEPARAMLAARVRVFSLAATVSGHPTERALAAHRANTPLASAARHIACAAHACASRARATTPALATPALARTRDSA